MPKVEMILPSGEKILLIYGVRYPQDGSVYINAVRWGLTKPTSDLAICYCEMEKTYAQRLAAEVQQANLGFDAVVSPPSSRTDADAYRKAILVNSNARDLTSLFSRQFHVKIGHNDITLPQAIDEIIYSSDGKEGLIKSLLIVDESIANGKTAAAILYHIRKAGLTKECKVTLVAWAKMRP